MKRFVVFFFTLVLTLTCLDLSAAVKDPLKRTDKAFFTTQEASRIGEQVLLWQRNTGGWPKNVDMSKPLSEQDREALLAAKSKNNDSTIDNDATTTQMRFLANLYAATGNKAFRNGFRRGLDYLLAAQYGNGGWPQFWPEPRGYRKHITFNDRAMENVMNLLLDISREEGTLGTRGLITGSQRKAAQKAFEKGLECILNCQIVVDGKPTVWCQQHDEITLEPAPARSFELASFCSVESAGLVDLLMKLDNPSQRIKDAVNEAMTWFEAVKIPDMEVSREGGDVHLVHKPGSKPLWARFYDFEECKPFVCGRDGVMKRDLSEIEFERRNGYKWYTSEISKIYGKYRAWSLKYDQGKTAISLSGDSNN